MFYLPTEKVCDYFHWPEPEESKREDIFTWYVMYNTYEWKRYFLFCNTVTGYVVRIYGIRPKEGKDFQDLHKIFLASLEESLRFDGFHPEAITRYLKEGENGEYGLTGKEEIKTRAEDQRLRSSEFLRFMNPQRKNQHIINHLVNGMPLQNGESPLEKMARYLDKYTEERVLTHSVYELDIRLDLDDLFVHRRLLIPKQYTLADLHGFIQILFGWTDSHLFEFMDSSWEHYYSLPEHFPDDDNIKDARFVTLEAAFAEKKPWTYIYDLGDYWRHTITFRRETKNLAKIPPVCTDYLGPNVPEDVGGATGYKEFLAAYDDPTHEEHDFLRKWFRSIPYNPFDIHTINADLASGRPKTESEEAEAFLNKILREIGHPDAKKRKPGSRVIPAKHILDTIIAAVNLYGIIHKDKVKEIHDAYEGEPIDVDTYESLFNTPPAILDDHFVYTVSDYFVHEALLDNEEWESVLAKQEGKPYHLPKKEAFYRYTDPYYFEKNEAYHELLRYLETNHFPNDKQKAANFLDDLVGMMHADYPMHLLLQEFTETSLSFKTLEDAQDALDLLVNLHNNLRMWENRGHTPNELSKGIVPPASEALFGEFSSSKRQKKVGRNDPCPCGSGKKYKHCCLGENPVS